MTDLWLFLLAVLTILGTPGPTNTLLATAGAAAGLRPSLHLLFAELSGYLISIGLIRAVLGPIFAAAPMIAIALKIVVAIYLVWVAIEVWRKTLSVEQGRAVTFQRVFIATLLNPKALIFALAIFPREPLIPTAHLAIFVVSVGLCGFSWIAAGRTLGAATGEHGARIIPRVAAVALGGFAGLILYSALG
jgi:threonine/homoserine/homoserine lactone efflux protein